MTAQDWPSGWLIMMMVPDCVKSAYGPFTDKFEIGRSSGSDTDLGKDFVAFGAMKNVDAGARTLGLGSRLSCVCGIGATKSILWTNVIDLYEGKHTNIW